jgi:hypothetical protein
MLDGDQLNRHQYDSENPTGGDQAFTLLFKSRIPPLARFVQSTVIVPGAVPGSAKPKPFEEIDMNTLTIKDLPIIEELDKRQMTSVVGGMGRTPQQILAWEMTGKPATWQGLVLGDDNRLHPPGI